jgi:hypothetical protein
VNEAAPNKRAKKSSNKRAKNGARRAVVALFCGLMYVHSRHLLLALDASDDVCRLFKALDSNNACRVREHTIRDYGSLVEYLMSNIVDVKPHSWDLRCSPTLASPSSYKAADVAIGLASIVVTVQAYHGTSNFSVRASS